MARRFPYRVNRRSVTVLSVVGILLIAATGSRAEEYNRSGLLLGFGIGLGVTTFTQTVSGTGADTPTLDEQRSASGDREIKLVTPALDFKLGAGGRHLQVYLAWTGSLFQIDNALGDDLFIWNAVGGLGLSYYLKSGPPSLYIRVFGGASRWGTAASSDEHSRTSTGFGIGGGVGWEFATMASLEATASWGNPRIENAGLEMETNALSFLVTINLIGIIPY